MRDLTYAELAERYGVGLCTGECGDSGHDDGWYGGRMVHFRERGVTRSGLRLFLMLVHDATVWRPTAGQRAATRRVRWIHSRNSFAYHTALADLGIRLPRKLSDRDRTAARYLLTKIPPEAISPGLRSWVTK